MIKNLKKRIILTCLIFYLIYGFVIEPFTTNLNLILLLLSIVLSLVSIYLFAILLSGIKGSIIDKYYSYVTIGGREENLILTFFVMSIVFWIITFIIKTYPGYENIAEDVKMYIGAIFLIIIGIFSIKAERLAKKHPRKKF